MKKFESINNFNDKECLNRQRGDLNRRKWQLWWTECVQSVHRNMPMMRRIVSWSWFATDAFAYCSMSIHAQRADCRSWKSTCNVGPIIVWQVEITNSATIYSAYKLALHIEGIWDDVSLHRDQIDGSNNFDESYVGAILQWRKLLKWISQTQLPQSHYNIKESRSN